MKRQIRSGVFETNSSSVHSLAINPKGRVPNKIKMDDGYLIAKFGVFDCSGKFTTQSEKLSYLVTCIWYIAGCPDDMDDMYSTSAWDNLEDAVRKYIPECRGVRMNIDNLIRDYFDESAPYIDHQSVPDSDWDMIIDMYDEDAVIDFIWNDCVGLKCSRD